MFSLIIRFTWCPPSHSSLFPTSVFSSTAFSSTSRCPSCCQWLTLEWWSTQLSVFNNRFTVILNVGTSRLSPPTRMSFLSKLSGFPWMTEFWVMLLTRKLLLINFWEKYVQYRIVFVATLSRQQALVCLNLLLQKHSDFYLYIFIL